MSIEIRAHNMKIERKLKPDIIEALPGGRIAIKGDIHSDELEYQGFHYRYIGKKGNKSIYERID